jgi:tetratricopeptide (TPR) repeat protein
MKRGFVLVVSAAGGLPTRFGGAVFFLRRFKMKKTITAAVFLFALTASAAFGQTTADEWYMKAGEYFESGDYANAITAYSEAIRRNSSNLGAYLFRGIAYYQIKNYDAAIADYNTIIKGAPDVPDGYILRGDAYGAKGIYHTAAADYKTGLEKGYDPGGFNVDKSSKAICGFAGQCSWR